MKRFGIFSAAVVSVLLLGSPWRTAEVDAQVATWFRADFSNPNANGQNQYNFGYVYQPQMDSGYWRPEHMPTGNYNGGPAVHIRLSPTADEYTYGWFSAIDRSFVLGDGFYLRTRIRLDDDYRWGSGGNRENKFVLWGGHSSQTLPSRFLLLWERPAGQMVCSLGANPANPGVNTSPSGFGLPGTGTYDWEASGLQGLYGSLSANVNISGDCAGPVLLTHPTNTAPYSIGPRSARPVNGWYHIQVYVKSGNGNGQFKIWANNNDFSNPTSTSPGITLGVDGWGQTSGSGGGVTVGGYMQGPGYATGYRLGAFEVGPTFDPNWAPATGSGPSPPTNLRIIS